MKTICLVLLVSFTLFACKKDNHSITIACNRPTNKLQEVKQLIAGSYEWVYTKEIRRLIGTYIHTPASTKKTNRYIFKRDGSVRYYENNQLIWSRVYTIDYGSGIGSAFDSSVYVIIKDNETGQLKDYFHAYLCNDSSLFYKPASVDNFRHYKRN